MRRCTITICTLAEALAVGRRYTKTNHLGHALNSHVTSFQFPSIMFKSRLTYRSVLDFAIALMAMSPICGYSQQPQKMENFTKPESIAFSGPEGLFDCVKGRRDKELYAVSDKLNPFYLRLDLDGDGKLDSAILIERARDKKLGILICWGNQRSQILFAGVPVEYVGATPSDDLAEGGTDYWWTYSGKIRKLEELPPPPLKAGEAIFFGKSESTGIALYWTGKRFVAYMGE